MAAKKGLLVNLWDKYDDFVLEALRIGVLAALSAIVVYVLNLLSLYNGDQAQFVAVLTLVLKSADRWLHEKGVAQKGIARF